MADVVTTKTILSVCATVASKLPNLALQDGRLIFVKDKHRLALDLDGKRTFYNQIEELATESDRKAILAPVAGLYYFVIDTAVLWTYQNGWIQVTTQPHEIVFIGASMPELGSSKTLYVNKVEKNISVWDEASGKYVQVANNTERASEADIDLLFI